VIDDEYFAMIARLDEARPHEECDGLGCEGCNAGMLPADDPFDESVWEKANPNIRAIAPQLNNLRGQAVEAKNKPSAKHDFLRYHCNIQVSTAVKLIDMDQWAKGAKELSDWSVTSSYGAFDLGWASDLASMSLTAKFFVDRDDEGNDRWRYETRQWSFIPSGTKADLTREPWASFIADGNLIVTDGATTDIPGAFKQKLLEVTEQFDCVQWAFDPHQARHLSTELENDEGMEVFKFPQNHGMYNESMLMFEKMIADQLYVHGGDPLLTWCAKHLRCNKDHKNAIMPDKKASREKIDPIVTSIMSLGGCMTGEQPNYWNPSSGVWL
jgi:phage terminase large subunit-like protein